MKNLPKNGKLPPKDGLNPSRSGTGEERERFVIAALASAVVVLGAAAAGWGWYHDNRQGYDHFEPA